MFTYYRKLNQVTKTNSSPILRDCIDNVEHSKHVTKFDSKGFWQIPLIKRIQKISTFATQDGMFQYNVMPFGMKNSPDTFQRHINMIVTYLERIDANMDDAIYMPMNGTTTNNQTYEN